MRFVVLMAQEDHFARWDRAGPADRERMLADHAAFAAAVRERGGTILAGEALDRPATARTVRPGRDRSPTEGPYAETVEQLGGLYLLELPDLETATGLAALLPSEYAVEVRPTVEVGP